MKAFQITGRFGLDALTLADLPAPSPGPGQVVVDVGAVSLNHRDLLIVRGDYDRSLPLPFVPCSDAAGVVSRVGEGVRGLAPGDRVVGSYIPGWLAGPADQRALSARLGGPLPGVLAEQIVAGEQALVKVPEGVSLEAAATLPVAGVTAWHALFEAGRTRPGDVVLVQGTGGVSLFALQLAHAAGARVIVTSRSAGKLSRALSLGAWKGIDLRERPAWHEAALELTEGRGVDHVVDVSGGDGLDASVAAARVGGRVSVVGFLSGATSTFSLTQAIRRRVVIEALSVGSRADLESLLRACASLSLSPVVDQRVPFLEAPRALASLAEKQHFGKIVVEVAA